MDNKIKINKIILKNFRGINGEKEFNLCNGLNVLDGENGFGKTTIFDAIEFCLTGDIKRLFEKNSKEAINKPLSIIRNINLDNLAEVFVEIIFSNGKNIKRIIPEGKTENIDNHRYFNEYNINLNIDEKSFYNYFYLPQTDTLDLIRESKNNTEIFLNKLLNISKETNLENKLSNPSKKDYWKKIIELQKNEYNSKEKDIKIELGEEKEGLEKTGVYKQIEDLKTNINKINKEEEIFKNNDNLLFTPINFNGEYKWNNYKISEKYTKDEIIINFLNSWKNIKEILRYKKDYFIYEDNVLLEKWIELINTNKQLYLDYYLYYDDFINNKSIYLLDLDNKIFIEKYISILKNLKVGDIELLLKTDKLFINLDNFSDYSFYGDLERIEKSFLIQKQSLDNLNITQKKYKEVFGGLIDFWSKFSINDNFNNKKSCPLCLSEDNYSKIDDIIKNYKISSGLDILDKSIQEHVTSSFFSLFDEKVLEKLENYLDRINTIGIINNNLRKFEDLINLKVSIVGLKIGEFSDDKTIELNNKLDKSIVSFKGEIKEIDIGEKEFIDLDIKIRDLFGDSFGEELEKLDNVEIIDKNIKLFEYLLFIYEKSEKNNMEKELGKIEERKKELENNLKIIINRINFINGFENNIINKYKEILSEQVGLFKYNMITAISVPFYIFTSRIVKGINGVGVYLTENSIQTFKQNGGNPSYTFSSGQLEGVVLSLILSVNLKQNISDFNTILIDDPIQSLDDLNILSLINLLKYQFHNKQILISTHDNDFSNIIRYKYDRLGLEQKNINMKDVILN